MVISIFPPGGELLQLSIENLLRCDIKRWPCAGSNPIEPLSGCSSQMRTWNLKIISDLFPRRSLSETCLIQEINNDLRLFWG